MKADPKLLGEGKTLMRLLKMDGYEAYAVGGCVRDAILQRPINDVDIATNATPEQVKAVIDQYTAYKLHPTGIEHGTWTVSTFKGETYEITSYRKDVATDGRRATVAFAKSMEEDAQRRDFTINALYMDADGVVHDPTGMGVTDMENGLLRFVGDASERCKEDYLRILRLFRFAAQIGFEMSPKALAAVQENVKGLAQVSGERKWMEFKKILSAPNFYPVVRKMDYLGVLDMLLPYYGYVPNIPEGHEDYENHHFHDWALRYVLLTDAPLIFPVSKAEKDKVELLRKFKDTSIFEVAYRTRDMDTTKLVRLMNWSMYNGNIEMEADLVKPALEANMPVTAENLMRRGLKGKEVGDTLRVAESIFIASHFRMCYNDLMSRLEELGMVPYVSR